MGLRKFFHIIELVMDLEQFFQAVDENQLVCLQLQNPLPLGLVYGSRDGVLAGEIAVRPNFLLVQAENLAGEYFITTGSGKYFRNVEPDPVHSIGIVEINDKGDSWRIVWGLEGGARPTSEFPSHYMNHCVRAAATGGECRVIYHAHPPQLIALTYVLPLEDRAFTRALWNTMTECPVIFPEGIGVVRWMVPGGRDIAVETSKLMERYNNVVWAHHGLFCAADSFDNAMGQMETIEKAARIWMLVHAVTDKPLQGITDDGYRAIGRDFRVEIPERFL